jgi:hypothetical protein
VFLIGSKLFPLIIDHQIHRITSFPRKDVRLMREGENKLMKRDTIRRRSHEITAHAGQFASAVIF